MVITIKSAELRETCKMLALVAPKRSSLPILTCALVLGDECGSVRIQATDLEQSAERYCQTADVTEPGAVALDLATLARFAAGVPKGNTVRIVTQGDGATLSLTATLHDDVSALSMACTCFPAAEYPRCLAVSAVTPLDLAKLLSNLRSCAVCVSDDLTRHVLQGIHLDPVRNVCESTDGRRAMVLDYVLPVGMPDIIVPPTRFLKTWKAVNGGNFGVDYDKATDPAGNVVNADVRAIALWSDGWTYQTKVVQGTYPTVQQVIPRYDQPGATCAWSMTVGATDGATVRAFGKMACTKEQVCVFAVLIDGQVALVSHDGNSAVPLSASCTLYPWPEPAKIKADFTYGEPGPAVVPEAIVLAIDWHFLADGMETGFVGVRGGDSRAPVRFESLSSDGASLSDVYVVMPYRGGEPDVIAAARKALGLPAPAPAQSAEVVQD